MNKGCPNLAYSHVVLFREGIGILGEACLNYELVCWDSVSLIAQRFCNRDFTACTYVHVPMCMYRGSIDTFKITSC